MNRQRWADFLLGNAQTFSQAKFDYTADLRQRTFEAYAQDEWRYRNNLTIYYGVRYSYFPSPYDKNGRLSTFVPELYDPSQAPLVTGAGNRVAGTGNWCNGLIVNSQNYTTGPAAFNCRPVATPFGKYVIDVSKKDFAQDLVWHDPFGHGKTSIRTGYGSFMSRFGRNVPSGRGLSPPYRNSNRDPNQAR